MKVITQLLLWMPNPKASEHIAKRSDLSKGEIEILEALDILAQDRKWLWAHVVFFRVTFGLWVVYQILPQTWMNQFGQIWSIATGL